MRRTTLTKYIQEIIVRLKVGTRKEFDGLKESRLFRGLRRYRTMLLCWFNGLNRLWDRHDEDPPSAQRYREKCAEIYRAAMS